MVIRYDSYRISHTISYRTYDSSDQCEQPYFGNIKPNKDCSVSDGIQNAKKSLEIRSLLIQFKYDEYIFNLYTRLVHQIVFREERVLNVIQLLLVNGFYALLNLAHF